MSERQVAVANGRFQVGVVEEGSGPPLLFLHGISGLNWGEAMELLAKNHRVIAPRHPGYGDASQDELDSVHDLAMENIKRVATDVVPNLRGVFSEWEDRWWPQMLEKKRRIEQRPMYTTPKVPSTV